jgi:hypothetical protein
MTDPIQAEVAAHLARALEQRDRYRAALEQAVADLESVGHNDGTISPVRILVKTDAYRRVLEST